MRRLAAFFLTFFLIGCSIEKQQASRDISYSKMKELSDNGDTFYFFLYAPWCSHCKVSVPIVKTVMAERNDYYFLNGEDMTRNEHTRLKNEMLNCVDSSDELLTSEGDRAFYPSLCLIKNRNLVFAKSGLPKTEKNISSLIKDIDYRFSL